jgi:hypothetical protein
MGQVHLSRPERPFSAYVLSDATDETINPSLHSVSIQPTLPLARQSLEAALEDGEVGIVQEWPGWEVLRLRREGNRYRELKSVTRRVNAEAERRLREILAEDDQPLSKRVS